MAEEMLDKLIEAVKSIKKSPQSETNVKQEEDINNTTTKEALANLFPSIGAASPICRNACETNESNSSAGRPANNQVICCR